MTNKNISLSLNTFSGVWNQFTAAHLLRRTLFGPKKSEIDLSVSLGLNNTISQLLDTIPAELDLPINYFATNVPQTPIGKPWVELDFAPGKEAIRKNSFRAWRMGSMLNQEMTIHQKLGLFWFNHFAMESDVVADTRGFHELSLLFYHEGLGSFKELVEKVTVSHSMLIYLNGNTNTARKPNENYARELFELFTVGKGPLIGEGDYTHYSEHDIQQAASVLSGFTTRKNPKKEVRYVSNRHNKDTKQFSYIFNEKVIENKEGEEYKELIDMIFEQDTAPKHICRKLYRWFIHYEINYDIETNIIEPLAQLMIDNDFLVRPVLEKLLSSEHFFDINLRGTQIKSPIDYTIGIQRQLEVSFPSLEKYGALYKLWLEGHKSTAKQLQSVSDAPDVAGWQAYYQEPTFYRSWISSVTLLERNTFSNKILGNGFSKERIKLVVNPFTVFDQFTNKDNPNDVIRQFTELLLPIEISDILKDELKEILIPGLPDFEWTVEYNDYKNDSNNTTKKNAIASKLIDLIKAIKNLPQFQLS